MKSGDGPRPGAKAVEVRARALELLREGRLTVAELASLTGRCMDLVADLIELPYGEDEVEEVDLVREIAIATLSLDLGHGDGGKKGPAR